MPNEAKFAYARLTGMLHEIPDARLASQDLVDNFNKALYELRDAGYDVVGRFQITGNDMVEATWGRQATTALLRSRINAVLVLFDVEEKKIGFEPPQS